MGRIKSIAIKTLGDELIKAKADSFTTDFMKNKQALNAIKPIKSKKVKNVLAGYITKKMKGIVESGI